MAAPEPIPGAMRSVMLKPVFPISLSRQQLLAARAHDMRRFAREPERRLWRELRGGLLGVVFRRQVVLGDRYIVDFCAVSVKLAVEVDGAIHARRVRADERRDRDLRRLGFHVLRVPAALVMKDLPAAVALVRQTVDELRR
jgi:very-short-patch-repair endonuclease